MLIDIKKAKRMGIFPCNVFCDGMLLRDVYEFDVEAGYAVIAERNSDDEVFIVNDEIATVKILGKITYEKIND